MLGDRASRRVPSAGAGWGGGPPLSSGARPSTLDLRPDGLFWGAHGGRPSDALSSLSQSGRLHLLLARLARSLPASPTSPAVAALASQSSAVMATSLFSLCVRDQDARGSPAPARHSATPPLRPAVPEPSRRCDRSPLCLPPYRGTHLSPSAPHAGACPHQHLPLLYAAGTQHCLAPNGRSVTMRAPNRHRQERRKRASC